jgi:hypothetical protein
LNGQFDGLWRLTRRARLHLQIQHFHISLNLSDFILEVYVALAQQIRHLPTMPTLFNHQKVKSGRQFVMARLPDVLSHPEIKNAANAYDGAEYD